MLNMVILVGRLGRDAKLEKTTGDMKDICKFALAVQESPNSNTEWIDCVAFDQPARFIGQYGKKGQLFLVVGRIHKNVKEKADGTKTYKQNVVAQRIKILERKLETQGYQSEVIKEASTAIVDDPQYIDDLDRQFMEYGLGDI